MSEDIIFLKSENKELLAKLNAENIKNLERENNSFIDGLANDGILFPSQVEEAKELLNLSTRIDKGEFITLSEGESLTSKFKRFLSKQKAINLTMQTANLSQPKKETVWRENAPVSSKELDHKIKNYMRNYNVDYKTAFEAITTIGE